MRYKSRAQNVLEKYEHAMIIRTIISSRLENYSKLIYKFNYWTGDLEKNWKLRRTNVSDKSPQSIQIIRLKSLITVRFNNLRMLVVALQDKAQFCCKLVSISCKVTTM